MATTRRAFLAGAALAPVVVAAPALASDKRAHTVNRLENFRRSLDAEGERIWSPELSAVKEHLTDMELGYVRHLEWSYRPKIGKYSFRGVLGGAPRFIMSDSLPKLVETASHMVRGLY